MGAHEVSISTSPIQINRSDRSIDQQQVVVLFGPLASKADHWVGLTHVGLVPLGVVLMSSSLLSWP